MLHSSVEFLTVPILFGLNQSEFRSIQKPIAYAKRYISYLFSTTITCPAICAHTLGITSVMIFTA